MRIPFEKMKETVTQGFNGGEGLLIAKIFEDDNNKILQAKLTPGSSVGLHRHVPTSETIFILSGKGKAFCGGVEEYLSAGDCHYCPKGYDHTLLNVGDDDLCFCAVVPRHEKA